MSWSNINIRYFNNSNIWISNTKSSIINNRLIVS
nr:MAG TPA: hypothetical protein [Caudoviricetes sp.]